MIAPSTEPINWGKNGQTPNEKQLAGQCCQAKFVKGMLKGVHSLNKGFFIEARAWDGVYLSNALAFELWHKWTGLLVEPNPHAFSKLKERQRRAWLLPQCLSTKTTPEVVEFHTSGRQGGIINMDQKYKPPNSAGIAKYRNIRRIQCFPLYTALLALGNPTVH